MRSLFSRALVALVLTPAACSSSPNPQSPDAPVGTQADARPNPTTPDAPSAGGTDFRMPGPRTVTRTEVNLTMGACDTSGFRFTPSGTSAGSVVLSHGFSRSAAEMEDLARHLASYGLTVTTPELCHLSIFDTDHPANGQELAAFGATLPTPRVYVGHSAGGLASVLAASDDSGATAVLGLDLVDANNLAANAVASMNAERFGILGEPSSCNASGNGAPLFDDGPLPGLRIVGANHCDFESPTTGGCTAFCGDPTGGFDYVKAFSAAYLAYVLELDASAAAWIESNGAERAELTSSGVIDTL